MLFNLSSFCCKKASISKYCVVKAGKACENECGRFFERKPGKIKEAIMASEQVILIVETEKRAAQIEVDARKQAEDCVAAAHMSALAECKSIDNAADTSIRKIFAEAQTESDADLLAEESASADAISKLRTLAGQQKEKAVQAAVDMLIGKA